MKWYIVAQLIFLCMMMETTNGLSSPIPTYANYTNSIELLANTSDLWWSINTDAKAITFELHIKTTGWIALGISPGRINTIDFHIISLRIFSWWYFWY